MKTLMLVLALVLFGTALSGCAVHAYTPEVAYIEPVYYVPSTVYFDQVPIYVRSHYGHVRSGLHAAPPRGYYGASPSRRYAPPLPPPGAYPAKRHSERYPARYPARHR